MQGTGEEKNSPASDLQPDKEASIVSKKLIPLLLALGLLCIWAAPVLAQEPIRLTWVQGTGAQAPPDGEAVMEVLNGITRERLGVEVEILYMTDPQLALALAAGEVYDMYFTCDWYNDYVGGAYAGVFADITELLPALTPELYQTLPEALWTLAQVGGRLYGIPVKKDYCPEIRVILDRDFYQSIGMDIPEDLAFEALGAYLSAYKEAHPEQYPLMLTQEPTGIDGIFHYVHRGAMIGINYHLAGSEEATTIVSILEDEEILQRLACLRAWYEAGYINPDAATLTSEALDSRQRFVRFAQGWAGAGPLWAAQYGYPVATPRISGPYLSASGVRGALTAFSATLEGDPQRLAAALTYQAFVNTDPAYRDILRYGIEGLHFHYNEDGTVTRTPEGLEKYNVWGFAQGSYAISAVEASQAQGMAADPDTWEKVFAGYESAILTADRGFAFDPTGWEEELAALTKVRDKWFGILFTGSMPLAESVPQCLAEMRAAGLDQVIAGAQAQFDDFLAESGAQ